MGGITSALGPILQIANIAAPFYKDAVTSRQQAQKDSLSYQQALANAAYQKQEQAVSDAQDEAKRRILLKRAVAKQRAEYGSQGIDTNDGSGEAVLLGLFNESDEQRALREQMSALRNNAIDQSVADKNQANLLLQQQLQQSQNLNQLMRVSKGGLLDD